MISRELLDKAELKEVNYHEGIENTLLTLSTRLQQNKSNPIEIVQEYNNFPKIDCYPGKLYKIFLNLV